MNVEYEVLICLGRGCSKAVSPASVAQHLRKIHKVEPAVRKQVQEFVAAEIPDWEYTYATVRLPANGSAP